MVQNDEKETLKMNQRFLSHTEDSARLQENPPTNKRDDSTKRFLCREPRDPSFVLEVPVHWAKSSPLKWGLWVPSTPMVLSYNIGFQKPNHKHSSQS